MKTKSGTAISPIGIGTWDISSRISSTPVDAKYNGVEPLTGNEEAEIEAIRYSIAKGQNHIDCAELYGRFYTDEVVGRAIEGLNREDLFVADKLWKTSVGQGSVRKTVNEMLRKLKTDYLDLLYIHAPWEGVPWKEAISQINELIDEGTVRHFGVSNFSVKQMQQTIKASKHPIIASQMYYNVLHKEEVDEAFEAFCKQNNITVVAYRPVERGAVLNNPVIKTIAAAHSANPAQVALAWLLQKGMIPIPKSIQKTHIDENLKSVELNLSEPEMTTLNNL